jgi:hypothetical protein
MTRSPRPGTPGAGPHREPAAGHGQGDHAAQRMPQHDGTCTGPDDAGDRGGETVEGVRIQRRRASVTGQVRRQPAPRPPPGQPGPPPVPDVAGRAEAVQQHQQRLPAAALVNPQASRHSRSLPPFWRNQGGAVPASKQGQGRGKTGMTGKRSWAATALAAGSFWAAGTLTAVRGGTSKAGILRYTP